jgi:NAD(P)H-nitrite reductase large subunit
MADHRKSQIQENPLSFGQSGQQICVCYDVYADEIIEAIQNGADSVEKISDLTYACQGCGSCHFKIEALLEGRGSINTE